MRLATLRRSRRAEALPGVSGVARLDRRTKELAKRLRPGEIAVIDHVDLDRASAEALVACRVAAVVNAAPSTSGRFPNLGPEVLLAAGIALLDTVGTDVFAAVREGDVLRVDGDTAYVADQVVATGQAQDMSTVAAAMAQARAGLHTQLEAFAANTIEYLLTERALLLDGVGVPDVRTDFTGRHALVVVAAYDYRTDLAMLRPYIREYRPVLVGVGGGADALLEEGLTPDVIVGDLDAVSDATLRCGAEVVVHAYADGRAPGLQRVQDLGVEGVVFPAAGTSEDVALLLADEKGAALIVVVGSHATLVEFLDKGREGMASTFLTRLRIGGKLVDAKGVSRLYRRRISAWSLLLLVASGLATMVIAVAVASSGRVYGGIAATPLHSFWSWLTSLLP